MKEIIYLDTDTMNSMLAQLDGGIIESFTWEENKQKTQTKGTASSASSKASLRGRLRISTGMLPGGEVGVDGTLGGSDDQGQNRSITVLDGQKDLLNKAFHDYALEVLFQDLEEHDLLKGKEDLKVGDILRDKLTFKFYDFNFLKSSADLESIEKLMLHEIEGISLTLKKSQEIVGKSKPTAKERQQLEDAEKVIQAHENMREIKEIMKLLNIVSTLGDNLLKNLAIIKAGNYIGLIEKSKLRESSEALSFRTDISRKADFLFQVIGEKKSIASETSMPVFSESDLDRIPNMMLDIVLGSFDILKKGDILIKPIAVFYE